jgi:hypothetical protein
LPRKTGRWSMVGSTINHDTLFRLAEAYLKELGVVCFEVDSSGYAAAAAEA